MSAYDPDGIIGRLKLEAHPEGGYFRETYRSKGQIPGEALPKHGGARPWSTAIYFLLPAGAVSRLHRLASDEVWHFYAGGPLVLGMLHADGREQRVLLGPDLAAGQTPQFTVPAGAWFGAYLAEGADYALAGCTVAPGFEFADFELADRRDLQARFPHARELIDRLAAPPPV